MFRNYVKIALRNLFRHKLFTSINILGLALGLAVCLVVVGHLSYEYSFEDCHVNKDHIYRVQVRQDQAGSDITYASTVAPLGEAIAEEIPDVEAVAIFRHYADVRVKIDEDERDIQAGNLIFANPDFFNVFTFPLRQGSPSTALDDPLSVLITEKAARTYFPDQNPVGRNLTVNKQFELIVTGVLYDVPTNTQLHCDFIASHSSLERVGEDTKLWQPLGSDYVYVLLNDGADWRVVEQKLPAILNRNFVSETKEKNEIYLKPLNDIYFNSWGQNIVGELEPRGEASFIFEMGMLAFFILTLAIVNFVNLSTARTSDRQKEVGMRKVFGARRTDLVKQFLGESIVIAVLAMLVSIVLYEIFKRSVGDLLPREMLVDFYNSPMMMLLIAGLITVVGVLAGFYPALYLSRFRPITVLQGKSSIKSGRSLIRKTLVVLQFVIAIFFVTNAVIMYNQTRYVSTFNLGFDRENILVLDFEGDMAHKNCALMKNEILSNCRVVSATASNCPPGRKTYTYRRFVTDSHDTLVATHFTADEEFLSTFGLKVTVGEGFSGRQSSESGNPVVVTSSVAERLSGNPIGQKFTRESRHSEIVGVIDDFYGGALDVSVDAAMAVITLQPDRHTSLSIKLPSDDITGSVASIRNVWENALPGESFEYSFLEDEIYHNLDGTRGQQTMFLVLALFTVLIACMGIFGLVSFTAEQRTKEIGVRKVLGASVGSIVTLLSREFLILIALANLIALPISYLMMSSLLESFAVRVGLGPGTFLAAGLIALVLALATAGSQAFKAANTDPVSTLRSN